MDTTIGREVYISHYGGLKCVNSLPVIEDTFENEELDTDFWEPFTRGSGKIKFNNGMIELHSGNTRGGLAKITSKKTANIIAGQNLVFEASLNMNSFNLEKPSIRWGMYSTDNSNALYFDFNSSSYFRFLYPLTTYTKNTIKFHNNFSSQDDYYNNHYSVLILDVNHKYEVRKIIDYDGATRMATLENELDDIVSSNSKYFLLGHVLSATTDSITISPNSSQLEDFYKGDLIYIYEGKGKGQLRGISRYDGTNKIIVVSGWNIIPDSTSVFIISSQVKNAGVNDMIIKDGFSANDDYYNGLEVMIMYGTGGGEIKKIKDYVGLERKVILENNWLTIPNSTVFQCVMRINGFNYAISSNNFDGLTGWKPPNYNITYRIIYSSEIIEFYVSISGRLQRLVTFKDIFLNFATISNYNMLFASANVNGNKNSFLQIRECNISMLGSQKLFRPLGENVTKRNLSNLTTSVLLGKTTDDKFKNILVDNEGKLVICEKPKPVEEYKYIIGRNFDVDKNEIPENLWQYGNNYTWLDSAKKLKVYTTDDRNKLSMDGAHKVKIEGLDDNYNSISEEITLNGKQKITTINSYLRVNDTYITKTGDSGTSVKEIYVKTDEAAAKFLVKINENTNSALNGFYTVPANKKATIKRIYSSYFTKDKEKEITGGSIVLKIREFGKAFLIKQIIPLNSNIVLPLPIEVSEKSDIILTVIDVNSKDFIVSGGFDIVLT